MKKKNLFIFLGVILFFLIGIVLILNQIGLFSSFNLSEQGTFYQNYPQINTGSNCHAPTSELAKLFSKESTIKTDTSTFKIVVTNEPFRPERSAGHTCAIVFANYDIYRNNVLIDTLRYDEWYDLLRARNVCTVPNPTEMKRAYSDDGTIKGEITELPNGVNGIEVFFTARGYNDGLSLTKGCRNIHIENFYKYKLSNDFGVEIKSLSEDKISYELNSPGSYYAVIKNKITNVGLVPEKVTTTKQLNTGTNLITLNLNYSENSNLQTEIILYKKTSDFSGLNANPILFEPFKNLVRFNQNTYFEIDDVSLKTLSLEIRNDEPIGFFQKIWNWVRGFFK